MLRIRFTKLFNLHRNYIRRFVRRPPIVNLHKSNLIRFTKPHLQHNVFKRYYENYPYDPLEPFGEKPPSLKDLLMVICVCILVFVAIVIIGALMDFYDLCKKK